MPVIVDTYIKDGETINVYESGVHYNQTRGRLIKAAPQFQITTENAKEFKERLAEKKREAVARGAAKVLESTGEWVTPNALDVAEAIAEAVMKKALNPDNPKQVDAARYIMVEAGMSESQTKTDADAQQFAPVAEALRQLADILGGALGQPREYIDGRINTPPAITDDDTNTRNE